MLEMTDKKEMVKTQASISNDEIKQYHMGCDKFWGGNKHYVIQKIKDTHVEDFELSHRCQKTPTLMRMTLKPTPTRQESQVIWKME